MKDFTRPRGRLASLPLPARVVYTVFLAFTLAGLAMSLWLTDDMVGLGLEQLDAYYAGVESAPAAEVAPAAGQGGPTLDLPDDLPIVEQAEPMPLLKLLEVTHFHLFSMPVYLMILSHLFMLGRGSDRSKLLWIGIGTLSTAGHIAAPWLARSGAASAAVAYGLTGSGLLVSYVVMSVVPLWEMWGPRQG